jgi:AmiR/NasT family two-component response regulator
MCMLDDMPAHAPVNWLIAAETAGEREALSRDLDATGMKVSGMCTCSMLVREIPQLEPDGVVLHTMQPSAELFDALAEWLPKGPCPFVVFTDRSDAEQTARAVELGVHAWVIGGYTPQRLLAVLQLARARWNRDARLRRQLDDARLQLDERKWVERAKGVLMAAREIDEDEAYRLLRNTAMQRQSRLSDVSRTVIDASNWAEAVNRAGQLRMLSQRLVRVFAQRMAKVGVRRAAELQEESLRRARENIARLEVLIPPSLHHPALTAVSEAWAALQAVIEGRLSAGAVAQANACAEVLLEAAERLTQTLEVASGRRALHVVNLSGRQRMLAQRVAKEAMLSLATGQPPSSEPMSAAIGEFEAALSELERAPLSSDPIRASLSAARDEWIRMMRSLAAFEQNADRSACAAGSDVLVQIFERLTDTYQRSLAALIG